MNPSSWSRLAGRFVVLCAVVFATVSPASAAWKEKVLHSFQSIPDGAQPAGALAIDKAGNLYGETGWGGADNCPGIAQCGVVYQVQRPAKRGGARTENVIYTFKGKDSNDGETPAGGVMFDAAGNLYGTTGYGGAGNCTLGGVVGCGTVFELSPPQQQGGPWTETILYSFQGNTDGYFPAGDLMTKPIFHSAGTLYGTALGGTSPNGVVFRLMPGRNKKWSFAVLYNFQGSPDGRWPVSRLVFDQAGRLYSATQNGGTNTTCQGGCGTVFEIWP